MQGARGQPEAATGTGLWLDEPDAAVTARRRVRNRGVRKHITDLISVGLTCLAGAISRELCDEVRDDYRAYCEASREASEHEDAFGHHARLANFHLASEAALRIGTDPRIMALLDDCFEARACIYSSLTFDRGTQQQVHSDSPHFCTEPRGRFLGVWIALEDIDPRAGPLAYHPGAHRIHVDPVLHTPRASRDDTGLLQRRYLDEVRARAEALTPLVEICPRQGDVLIWHPDLPHGGARVSAPSLTRASIVFHCVPEGTRVSGPEVFFGLAQPPDLPPAYAERFGRKIEDHGYAHFAPDA